MNIINILTGIAAAVLFLGVMAEKDPGHRRHITIAFVAVIALIIAFNIKF